MARAARGRTLKDRAVDLASRSHHAQWVARTRIIGPGGFLVFSGLAFMGFWLARLIAEPNAGVETIVVLPLSAMIVWRFLRVGVFVDGQDILLRNMWGEERWPAERVQLRGGVVDDISEFDRFTGGHTSQYRARVGDQFATRTFLRHRFFVDGEEHDIDAMYGRVPKSQTKAAEKIRAALSSVA